MRRLRSVGAAVLVVLMAGVAAAQTVRIIDGTSPNLVKVNADGSLNTTAGASAVCSSTGIISQATGTQIIAGTTGKKTLICALVVMSATAQNVSVVEGTGSVCGTNTVGLVGGVSPSMPLTANGGFAMTASAPWLQTASTGTNVCVLQASTGGVSGTITFIQQ